MLWLCFPLEIRENRFCSENVVELNTVLLSNRSNVKSINDFFLFVKLSNNMRKIMELQGFVIKEKENRCKTKLFA